MKTVRLWPVLGFVCVLAIPRAWGRGPEATVAESCSSEICSYGFLDLDDPCAVRDADGHALLTFGAFDANDRLVWAKGFESIDAWRNYARNDPNLARDETEQVGWTLSGGKEDIFWQLQAIIHLYPEYYNLIESMESRPVVYDGAHKKWLTLGIELTGGENRFDLLTGTVFWSPGATSAYGGTSPWDKFPPLAALAHELVHAYQRAVEDRPTYTSPLQVPAMKYENLVRDAFRRKVPNNDDLRPRPGNMGFYLGVVFQYLFDEIEWADWWPGYAPLLDVFEEE